MIILGLLLLLGAAGLSLAAIWANQSVFESSAGVVELMGRQAEVTVGEVFLVGATAGALTLFGLFMLFSGMGRGARRRAAARRELRDLRSKPVSSPPAPAAAGREKELASSK